MPPGFRLGCGQGQNQRQPEAGDEKPREAAERQRPQAFRSQPRKPGLQPHGGERQRQQEGRGKTRVLEKPLRERHGAVQPDHGEKPEHEPGQRRSPGRPACAIAPAHEGEGEHERGQQHHARQLGDGPRVTGLVADLSLVKAWKADTEGNLIYRKTAGNFNPMMATAGKVTVVEVEEVVEAGTGAPIGVIIC